jgi:hypothetical protein
MFPEAVVSDRSLGLCVDPSESIPSDMIRCCTQVWVPEAEGLDLKAHHSLGRLGSTFHTVEGSIGL